MHRLTLALGLLLPACSLVSLAELSDGTGGSETSTGTGGGAMATSAAGGAGGATGTSTLSAGGSGAGSEGGSGGTGGTGGGTSCVETGVLDDFDRPNGPLGANWSMSRDFSIDGNRVRNILGTQGYLALWNVSYAARQEAHIVLSMVDTQAQEQLIALKADGTSRRIEVLYSPLRSTLEIWLCDPNCEFRDGVAATATNGAVLSARATETGLVTVCLDGTERLTTTLTGWPFNGSAGRIGFGKLQNDLSRPMAFDDFGGGSLP